MSSHQTLFEIQLSAQNVRYVYHFLMTERRDQIPPLTLQLDPLFSRGRRMSTRGPLWIWCSSTYLTRPVSWRVSVKNFYWLLCYTTFILYNQFPVSILYLSTSSRLHIVPTTTCTWQFRSCSYPPLPTWTIILTPLLMCHIWIQYNIWNLYML